VKLSEEDFEGLENDQLLVQSMVSSRYLATFEREVRSVYVEGEEERCRGLASQSIGFAGVGMHQITCARYPPR
jgi:hypothetical protein